MTNPWYTPTGNPATQTRGLSEQVRSEFELIETAFDDAFSAIDPAATQATSTTSLTVGLGTKSLTIETDKAFFPGQSVAIADAATPTNRMVGVVTSSDPDTGALVVESLEFTGSGTYTDWTIALSPTTGATLGTNTFTGAQNEAKGADIASAATVNLTTATGNLVHITGTTTITAITLGSGYERTVVFDGALTLTHNATTLILPGGGNIKTGAGDVAIFRGDGSGNTRCISYQRASTDNVVILTQGNGHGSVDNKIRRYSTTQQNTGTAITVTDSATEGTKALINEAGFYEVYMLDASSGGTPIYGISVNSNQNTTTISSITATTRFGLTRAIATNTGCPLTRTLRLSIGDVVRPHTDGTPDETSVTNSLFSIRKVG